MKNNFLTDCYETDISTKQPKTTQQARFPGTDEHEERKKDPEPEAAKRQSPINGK